MPDSLLESIRAERADVAARLKALAAEAASLQARLTALDAAAAALAGDTRPVNRVRKDMARAVGGHARAQALDPARRSEIAKRAAAARWKPK